MADSIAKPAICKPDRPYSDFPLYPHDTKRWSKKIKGKTHYFGPWDDWKGALERYQYERDYLYAGKTPPPKNADAYTVGILINDYLRFKDDKVQSNELSQRTWDDLKRTGAMLIEELGRNIPIESLDSDDFAALRAKLSKRLGLVALANEIARSRSFFNYAFKNNKIDKPVKMGTAFDKPSKDSLKRERLSKPVKMFTIEELTTIYKAANAQMRCFMLLGLNGGLIASDIGQMEAKHIQDGWCVFPRPKTTVEREFPFWKETVKAIEATRQTQYDSPLLFVTKYGMPWFKGTPDSPLGKEFTKLLEECNIPLNGRGFSALRHNFRTYADGCRDRNAIDVCMGHTDSSMGRNYTHGIEPERLQAVVDHVRAKLAPMFAPAKPVKKSKGGV
jgi:integrase